CAEATALFVISWYTLGIAASAALGALAGPRLLRW
ncbi:NrsF family protein, partial [Acinetobacter baumannii]